MQRKRNPSARGFLPVQPLLPILETYHRQHVRGCQSYSTWTELARRTGVNERAFRRWMTGESKSIDLAYADRICMFFGLTINLVWDHDTEHGKADREMAA